MIELSPNLKRTLNGTLLVVVLGLVLWALGPVLTPFIVAAVLAYALNPLVDRISGWLGGRVPRWLAVVLVMLVFILAVLGVAMLIVPVVIKEATPRAMLAKYDAAKAAKEASQKNGHNK